jgi:chemotaxis protein MotA
VLENLSQPDKLGHLIAGAFVATLWGVLSANVMFLPWGKRIKYVAAQEAARMELIIDGVSGDPGRRQPAGGQDQARVQDDPGGAR